MLRRAFQGVGAVMLMLGDDGKRDDEDEYEVCAFCGAVRSSRVGVEHECLPDEENPLE